MPPPPVLSALHLSWWDSPGSDNDTSCASFHDLVMILVKAEACRGQNEELLQGAEGEMDDAPGKHRSTTNVTTAPGRMVDGNGK